MNIIVSFKTFEVKNCNLFVWKRCMNYIKLIQNIPIIVIVKDINSIYI